MSENTKIKKRFWHDGLKFECRQCGYCCTFPGGAIFGTELEFKKIAAFIKVSYEEFLKNYTKNVSGYVSLISRESGPCIFYENGCTIYPLRPTQCRTFPFWGEILKSEVRWQKQSETCQGIDKGRTWSGDEIREQLISNRVDLLKIRG